MYKVYKIFPSHLIKYKKHPENARKIGKGNCKNTLAGISSRQNQTNGILVFI